MQRMQTRQYWEAHFGTYRTIIWSTITARVLEMESTYMKQGFEKHKPTKAERQNDTGKEITKVVKDRAAPVLEYKWKNTVINKIAKAERNLLLEICERICGNSASYGK